MNLPLMYGNLNPLLAPVILGSINTPPETSTNANNVAILVKSSTNDLSVKRMGIPTTKPVTIVANDGVLNFG